jgi:CheY-like chemotaxis protein
VDAVSSGSEALLRLGQQEEWNLVLSDVVMPEMGGFELATLMKERGVTTPIVLVSGYAARSGVDEGSEKLPRITKPFSLEALLSFVGQHARKPSLHIEQ